MMFYLCHTKIYVNQIRTKIVSISETSLLYSRVRSDRNQLTGSGSSANNANSNANNSPSLSGSTSDNASDNRGARSSSANLTTGNANGGNNAGRL